MINLKKQDPVADAVKDILQQEALKGNQHKIDKNKNNKIDAHDFKILRGEKPEVKKEEVEQIDELKKSTLGSYVSKASRDATIQRKIGADFETLADKSRKPSMKKAATTLSDKYKAKTWSRLAGVDKAVSRLSKEEVEDIEEGNNPFDYKNYKSQLPTKPGEKAGFDSKKISTGTVYNRKPVKDDEPVRKEEVEQIDELKSTTLQSYKTAAHKSLGANAVARHAGEISSKEYHATANKRSKGINRADADKRLGTYADKTPKKLDISAYGSQIQKQYHSEETEQVEAKALIENYEIINEVSVGAKIRAYAQHSSDAFDHYDMGNSDEGEHHENRADKILAHIEKHHGAEAVKHAQKAAHSATFGRGGHSRGSDSLSGGLRGALQKTITKAGKIPKNTQSAVVNQRKTYGSRVTGPKGHLPEEVEHVDEASSKTVPTMANAPKMVRDRKTGQMYDPNKKFKELMDKPETKAMLDRLAKEDVEQVDERELSKGETAEKERIVKGMKKGFSGFRQRYGDRAKSVMYATATKNAMKEEALEEGKRPEGDTVPFVQNANTSSSPMKKIKEVAGAAMKKIYKDLKTK